MFRAAARDFSHLRQPHLRKLKEKLLSILNYITIKQDYIRDSIIQYQINSSLFYQSELLDKFHAKTKIRP